MVDHSFPGAYVTESDASSPRIEAVDTSTVGMVGAVDFGPADARLVTSYAEFTALFGESATAPTPEVQARWRADAVDGGQWWNFGLAIKTFFDNGGERLCVKGVLCSDPASLSAADFVRAIDGFETVGSVSILLAPGLWSTQVQAALIAKCESRGRCFAILDPPAEADAEQVRNFRMQRHSPFAALYYPWLEALDTRAAQPVPVPPSAAVAGVYARVDRERGVFKAPANEALRGVESLAREVTHAQADLLNAEGINSLRAFGDSIRVWGARTLSGGDWKYVNVRRLFIYLERSIDEGTQWVVFEPNGESLWARVRESISDFLSGVWRQGALAGSKPEEAFFVRCDRTTMSQDDLDRGRLVCLVGIAPLRPAEFVIVRIGQWTADHDGPVEPSEGADDDPPWVRLDRIPDRTVLCEAIGPARRFGRLVVLTGGGREARLAAACELAGLAGLSLFRIELSRVVSKYVAETEKNLERIFGAARGESVVLFFDEADALFGRRTEVGNSHDRYAGIEIAYLLQRIDTFEGIVVLATNQRCDLPAHVRRRAGCGVEAGELAEESRPWHVDLSSSVDREIVSIDLTAVQVLYFAAMLEELRLFSVVDRLIELFQQGALPVGASEARTRLSEYAQSRETRLSATERRRLYTRVFGMPGGDDDAQPNRDFSDLWIRFVTAVASWDGRPRGDNDSLRACARELASNLSLHGWGLSLYAATELAETIRDAIAILADPLVCAAFGARDMWQVIERVATQDLGGARNCVGLATMAAAGAKIITWLSAHLDRLAAAWVGEAQLATDAALVTACASWLAAAEGLDGSPGPAGGLDDSGALRDFAAHAAVMLAAVGASAGDVSAIANPSVNRVPSDH